MTKSTRTMNEADFLRTLNEGLRENELWRDLFKAVGKVMTNYVHERATQHARIRAPQHVRRGDYLNTPLGRGKVAYIQRAYDDDDRIMDEVEVEVPGTGSVVIPLRTIHPRSVLINGARSMGFDFFSGTLTDEDYERIYRYIGHYWQWSGTSRFVDFIGYIKNMRLEIEQLWTRDKGDNATSDDPEISKYSFLETFDQNNMIPVWIDTGTGSQDVESDSPGKDYPTSHVVLSYDIIVSQNLNLPDLVNLFYYLAPIHLVLERIQAAVNVEVPVYRGYSSEMHYYAQGHLILDSSFNGMIDFTNSTTRDASIAKIKQQMVGKVY